MKFAGTIHKCLEGKFDSKIIPGGKCSSRFSNFFQKLFSSFKAVIPMLSYTCGFTKAEEYIPVHKFPSLFKVNNIQSLGKVS